MCRRGVIRGFQSSIAMTPTSRRRASRWTPLALIGACAFASRIHLVSSARVDRVGVKDAFIERLGDVFAIATVDGDDDDGTMDDETVVMTTEDAIARVDARSGRVAWRATHEREMDGLAASATTTHGKDDGDDVGDVFARCGTNDARVRRGEWECCGKTRRTSGGLPRG